MDTLRVILIVIGVAIVAAVYFFERSRRRGVEAEQPLPDDYELPEEAGPVAPPDELDRELEQLGSLISETRLPGESAAESLVVERRAPGAVRAKVRGRGARAAETDTAPGDAAAEKIVVMHVAAHRGGGFRGERVLSALQDSGLTYGAMRIFHRAAAGASGETGVHNAVFSVANMLEPGVFDLEGVESFTTPGITLFMRLPGPVDGTDAFEAMLATATELAEMLGGELRDETRSVMSRQTVEHLREEIREFQRRLRLAQRTV
jgi:cell division protein ZipA